MTGSLQTLQVFLRSLGRGAWFDVAVCLANWWFVAYLTAVAQDDGEHNLIYAALLLLSIVLTTLGSALKRQPLQLRLAKETRMPVATWVLIVFFILMILQFALYMMSCVMAFEAIHFHFPRALFLPEMESPLTMVATLMVASVPVSMTIRALIRPQRLPAEEPVDSRRQEWMADMALYFSALISLSIWDGFFITALPVIARPLCLDILLVVLLIVPFAIFYAAPRILFLVEDYFRPATWIGIAVAMLPMAVRFIG